MKLPEIVRRKEGIMSILSGSLVLVLLLGTVPVVWAQADPAKEIADINRKRGEAGAKGDVDAWLADVADNVVVTAARAGFRMEGKEALRAFITNLWQNYPTRQELGRQVTSRVFQEGNVVVVNGYTDQTLIDRNGRMSVLMQRTSQTWVKTGGRWLLVDTHVSGMPGTPYTP
jgi:ketosteroid isomerase-like protein